MHAPSPSPAAAPAAPARARSLLQLLHPTHAALAALRTRCAGALLSAGGPGWHRRPAAVCRCSSSSSSRPPADGSAGGAAQHRQQQPAQRVSAVVEQQAHRDATQEAAAAAGRPGGGGAPSAAAAPSTDKEAVYKALLAIIMSLQSQQQEQQQQQQEPGQAAVEPSSKLSAFLRSQPVSTSIPFISWLADLEAQATGPFQAQLASLCEQLLVAREQQDRAGQEALYSDSLRLLSGGNDQVLALMRDEPRAYALALAEAMNGAPVNLQGYTSPAYDALLQVAPPAALTPAAVAQGHALAEELSTDLSARRKSTLAAMLGRVRLDSLSPEQEAALLGPSPAARILDLLLSLASGEERLALLPDCFTPPPAACEQSPSAAAAGQQDEAQDSDELWCTPMQLLNEVDRRLRAAAAGSGTAAAALPGSTSVQQPLLLPGLDASSTAAKDQPPSPATLAALQELRHHIEGRWLQSLPQRSLPAE